MIPSSLEKPSMTERITAMQQQLAVERPLDVQVSTRVMGWHLSHDGLNYRWTDEQGDRRKYITEDSWSPSTSIADAWEVVEKMREKGYWVDLQSSGIPGIWQISITKSYPPNRSPRRPFVEASHSAPLAICLDALSALSSFPDSTKEGETK